MVTPAAIVNIASGALFAILGLLVALAIRPRRLANVAFGTYAVAFGLIFIANNVGASADIVDAGSATQRNLALLAGTAAVAASLSLVVVAGVFPKPIGASERRLLIAPALLAGALSVIAVLVAPTTARNYTLAAAGVGPATYTVIGTGVLRALLWGAALLMALRFAAEHDSASLRRRFAVLGVALPLWPAAAELSLIQDAGLALRLREAEPYVLAIALSVVWLWCSSRGRDSRVARNVALVLPAMPLLGLVFVGIDWNGAPGTLRVISVLLLAYAIVRHQLLGIDVKLKLGLRRGTIAGIFVGVLFVVANVAQNVLGQEYGLIFGGVATGLLLFAIAPLQRFAERFANAAVEGLGGPHAQAAPATMAAATIVGQGRLRREDVYRKALRIALRDRVVTRDEEVHLFQLADELGIGAGRAMELRHEVEAEPAERA